VVELDPQDPPASPIAIEVESLMLHAKFIEVAESLAREVTDLRVVAFAFEFGDDDDGENYGMLSKTEMAFGSERRTDVSRTYVRSACLPFAYFPSFGLFFASGLASWGTCTPSPGAYLPPDVLTRKGHMRLKTNLCGRLDRANFVRCSELSDRG